MEVPTREYLFGSIFLLANRLQTLGDGYLEEVTLKQWLLLIMIHVMDRDQPSVTEVADFMGGTRQNVRKMLEVLEGKSFVTLSANSLDRRTLSVALTPKTEQLFVRFQAKGDAFLDRLFDGIPPEDLEATRRTVEALFENMERMGEEHV
ncbi:hypothetical protein JQM66_06400 [Oscillibacter valericigenes]|uniref:MarR family winged helix-turn-helix transcriptional regulator n=1 Tax=Oscillibacter valericigenes TaxID=351091 RepID=UPI001F3754FF|nr:hypothetical protein [Oscillibacter valericigenes]MCF2664191.1 hypothetical protein [Oscillibacter valericigenes]